MTPSPSAPRHLRGRGPRILLVIGVVAALMVTTAASTTTGPSFSLMVSDTPNLDSAIPLAGAELNGGEYIFLTPTSGVTSAAFWIDDASMAGTATHVETFGPIDTGYVVSIDDAWPLSDSAVVAGVHQISAKVVTRSVSTAFATSFTVRGRARGSSASATTSVSPGGPDGTDAVTSSRGATPAPRLTTKPGATGAAGTPGTTTGPQPTTVPTARLTPAPTARLTPAPTPVRTSAPTPSPVRTPAPTTASPGWTTIVSDQFNSGGVPSHWTAYDGPYGSGPQNCAAPSQVTVSGGYLHLKMSYLASGGCGAGWYSGGLALRGLSTVDQRITVRFRVVDVGSITSHMVIPMRWVDNDALWPAGGEEDYFEGDSTGGMNTYLHYGSRNSQIYSPTYRVDLTQWHTIQTTRRDHVVTVSVDGVSWTYSGSASTLPDTLKHVVLQQECQSNGCPAGTTGSEDIQIDWLTVENAG